MFGFQVQPRVFQKAPSLVESNSTGTFHPDSRNKPGAGVWSSPPEAAEIWTPQTFLFLRLILFLLLKIRISWNSVGISSHPTNALRQVKERARGTQNVTTERERTAGKPGWEPRREIKNPNPDFPGIVLVPLPVTRATWEPSSISWSGWRSSLHQTAGGCTWWHFAEGQPWWHSVE